MKKTLLLFAIIFSISQILPAQTTVTIPTNKDNTLYESGTGALSNGAGAHLFAGLTNSSNLVRRALIQFDLNTLPANAVIDTVVLFIDINKVNASAGTDSLNLHVLTADWGEGTSNAPSNEGGGTTASTGDATWIHTFSPNSNWATAGGDFNASASAGISTNGTGSETFGSTQLTADVQNWLNNPTQNFGWIILGTESPGISARRIGSKDGASGGPTLRVTYTTVGLTESVSTKKIEIYPIPAEDYLMIEHRRNVFTNEVRVFDTNGKLVMEEALGMDNRLNVSELNSGIYFLELRTKEGNEAVSQKFVKN